MSEDLAAVDVGRVEILRPLTRELVATVLDSNGYHHAVDEDGDIYGWWEQNLIYFLLDQARETVQVRTRAHRVFPVQDVPRLYAFCNHWNQERFWPKAYLLVLEDQPVTVWGEVIARLAAGVTTEQLDRIVQCGIATGCDLAAAVAELG
ncbi:MAG: YbjN domain-containing protein [Micromonosporaceae bacterium]|nr:YbjN domain-containing protein [Micromonosporaceae bacterium]